MANSDRIKSFYESFAAYLVKNRIIDNPRHTKIFGFLDKIFAQHTISSALEIGCGIGIISEYINKDCFCCRQSRHQQKKYPFRSENGKGYKFSGPPIFYS